MVGTTIRHNRGLPIELISHVDLNDMPDIAGVNSDHDARYYTQAQLGSVVAPSGSSLIGVEDAGGFFAGADVEAILQEIMVVILPGAYLRLDGTNVPTAAYNWITALTTTSFIQAGNVYIARIGDDPNTRAGYFTDGVRIVELANPNQAVDATDGTYTAYLADSTGGMAGYFTDGPRFVEICNGGYGVEVSIPDDGYAWYSYDATVGDYIVLHDGVSNLANFTDGATSDYVHIFDGTHAIYTTGDIRTDAHASIGGAMDATARLKIITDADDIYGIYLDRTTTDFTTSGTEPHNVFANLGVNWGTGNVGWCRSFRNQVTMSNTDAIINTDNYWFLFYNYLDNNGRITNTGATDRTLFIRNQQAWTDDDGNYDTDSTGKIEIESRGVYIDLDSNPIFHDTGGNTPSNTYRTYGVDIQINSNPVLNDGALLTQEVRGVNITGSITTEGGLYNRIYGIYISSLNGGWRQYGIYNNDSDLTYFIWSEGGDIALDKDDNKIIWGESQDGSMYWTTEGDDHLKIDPQEAAAGHYLIINVPKTTTGDPANPIEGLIYWNTIDNVIKMYADAGWRTLASW